MNTTKEDIMDLIIKININNNFECEHKYQDNICDWRGVRKCVICSKLETNKMI